MIKALGKDSFNAARLGLDDREYGVLLQLSQNSAPLLLNRLFTQMLRCQAELEDSALDRYVFENCCLEWCLTGGGQSRHAQLSPTNDAAEAPSSAQDKRMAAPDLAGALSSSKTGASVTEAVRASSQQVEAAEVPAAEPMPKTLPADWATLVAHWKRERPLQARKLEELYPVAYGPKLIRVEVDPDGMVGPTLLQKQTQDQLAEQFRSYFGFEGVFEALPRGQSKAAATQETSAPAKASFSQATEQEPEPPAAGESLLSIKQREQQKSVKK